MVGTPPRFSSAFAILACALLAGCASGGSDGGAQTYDFQGQGGYVFLSTGLDELYSVVFPLKTYVSLESNGTGPPKVYVGSGDLEFTPSDKEGVFGAGPDGPTGPLQTPSRLKGEVPVAGARGTFFTDFPEDLGMLDLYGMKGWTWDAMFVVLQRNGSNPPRYDAHLLLSRNATADGGLRMGTQQNSMSVGGLDVNIVEELQGLVLGARAHVRLVTTGSFPGDFMDLDVRILHRGKALASGKLDTVSGKQRLDLDFLLPKPVPIAYEPAEDEFAVKLEIKGKTSTRTIYVQGWATLDTPAIDMSWPVKNEAG